MPKTALCITPKCSGEIANWGRGLCAECYTQAKRLVESKKTTWDDLERMGLVASKGGNFSEAFLAAKKLETLT